MLDITQPPPHPLISASILSADFSRMAEECRDVLSQGADMLHFDVMDGHFVPNLTMGADMVRCLRRQFPDTFLDVHLMVERPDQFLDMFAAAGASLFNFHVEVCDTVRPAARGGIDGRRLIDAIHARGLHAGMTINPPTDVRTLEPYLHAVELILVMSVNPGRSGQAFIPEVLSKARWLKPRLSPRTRLELDGGLSPTTAPAAVAAGVDVMVTASALFGAPDRGQVIRQLHAAGVGHERP